MPHYTKNADDGRIKPASAAFNWRKPAVASTVLFLLLAILNLAGCGQKKELQWELGRQPLIITETEILRGPPVVHIAPVAEAGPVKVLFMPFRVTQIMSNPEMAGYGVSRLFWQTWAARRVFEYMEFVPDRGPFRLDTALALARARGADMLIGGYITNFMDGGAVAQSNLALQVEAYDVGSGLMVWSMAQAGTVERPRRNDNIIFATMSKTPGNSIYALTVALAGDMGEVMRAWSDPEAVKAEQEARAKKEAEKSNLDKAEEFLFGSDDNPGQK